MYLRTDLKDFSLEIIPILKQHLHYICITTGISTRSVWQAGDFIALSRLLVFLNMLCIVSSDTSFFAECIILFLSPIILNIKEKACI